MNIAETLKLIQTANCIQINFQTNMMLKTKTPKFEISRIKIIYNKKKEFKRWKILNPMHARQKDEDHSLVCIDFPMQLLLNSEITKTLAKVE